MQIRVGITANDLKEKLHNTLVVSCPQALTLVADDGIGEKLIPAGTEISIKPSGPNLSIKAGNLVLNAQSIALKPKSNDAVTTIKGFSRQGSSSSNPQYRGQIELNSRHNKIQLVIVCDIETYMKGVLASEIPASYHLEAVKAQAVAARTYALRPRIDHTSDGFNVCDSYLCCQYFAGIPKTIAPRHEEAIDQTKNQILTYQDKPILALFSAVAGGHTENYENCFSDPLTGEFPPAPLPYLKGVAEGKLPPGYPSEKALRDLYNTAKPDTCDAASNKFRWRLTFSANQLESHMHHVIETLRADPLMSPFIFAPPSGKFGHIQNFETTKRGVAGTAISLTVHTSSGPWVVQKELVIRSLFKNPELSVARLKSARMFFDQKKDNLGLLSQLTISGFGWGHGVGLQQTGAQGLALQGKNYKQILSHYFTGAQLTTV